MRPSCDDDGHVMQDNLLGGLDWRVKAGLASAPD